MKKRLCVAHYNEDLDWLKNIVFGGRLAEYKYYDMDKVIESSLLILKKMIDVNHIIDSVN